MRPGLCARARTAPHFFTGVDGFTGELLVLHVAVGNSSGCCLVQGDVEHGLRLCLDLRRGCSPARGRCGCAGQSRRRRRPCGRGSHSCPVSRPVPCLVPSENRASTSQPVSSIAVSIGCRWSFLWRYMLLSGMSNSRADRRHPTLPDASAASISSRRRSVHTRGRLSASFLSFQ